MWHTHARGHAAQFAAACVGSGPVQQVGDSLTTGRVVADVLRPGVLGTAQPAHGVITHFGFPSEATADIGEETRLARAVGDLCLVDHPGHIQYGAATWRPDR